MKRPLFYLVGLLLTYGIIEAFSYAAFRAVYRRGFSFSEMIEARRAMSTSGSAAAFQGIEEGALDPTVHQRVFVPHPFMGYTIDPDAPKKPEVEINAFGMWGDPPSFQPNADEVTVVITGGSVAAAFWSEGAEILAGQIGRLAEFRDKPIHVVDFAMPGVKQPQQLLSVAYFLSLGADIDDDK